MALPQGVFVSDFSSMAGESTEKFKKVLPPNGGQKNLGHSQLH